MDIASDGSFTFMIGPQELSRGLRNSKRSPRNNKLLVECAGAVGLDGVLQVLDDLSGEIIDTSVITDAFPYPQIFVFPRVVIVCGQTKIYEYVSSALTLRITASIVGAIWSAVSFGEYVYMSNSEVTIVRRAEDGVFEEVTDKPLANAICDYNGQVLIGAV